MPRMTSEQIQTVRENIAIGDDGALMWIERHGQGAGKWNALFGGFPIRVADPGNSRSISLEPLGLTFHVREADLIALLGGTGPLAVAEQPDPTDDAATALKRAEKRIAELEAQIAETEEEEAARARRKADREQRLASERAFMNRQNAFNPPIDNLEEA